MEEGEEEDRLVELDQRVSNGHGALALIVDGDLTFLTVTMGELLEPGWLSEAGSVL